MADDCKLVDRATGQPPAANDPFWQKGEVQVGGPNDANLQEYARARRDAIRRATRACEDKLLCEGTCDSPDERLCAMGVEVLKSRSGRVEERKVRIPAGVFVERDVIQYYATWEVQVRCRCSCARVPKPVLPGRGPSKPPADETLFLIGPPFFLGGLLSLMDQALNVSRRNLDLDAIEPPDDQEASSRSKRPGSTSRSGSRAPNSGG